MICRKIQVNIENRDRQRGSLECINCGPSYIFEQYIQQECNGLSQHIKFEFNKLN